MSNSYPRCNHCGDRHKQCEPTQVELAGLEFLDAPRRVQEFVIPMQKQPNRFVASVKRFRKNLPTIPLQEIAGQLNKIPSAFRMEVMFVEVGGGIKHQTTLTQRHILRALEQTKIIESRKNMEAYSELKTNQFSINKPAGIHIKLIED